MQKYRFVSEHGERLLVRTVNGSLALTDPCDECTVVHVETGRRARLIDFHFSGRATSNGRDALTKVFYRNGILGFASVQHPTCRVYVSDLTPGQIVDVLPAANPAAAYAAVIRPLPVLYGAAAAVA